MEHRSAKVRLDYVLALDLEGTLICTFRRPDPRPGLRDFLEWSGNRFRRVVVFTGVHPVDFRFLARQLAAEGLVPAWFAGVEHFGARQVSPGPPERAVWKKDLSWLGEEVRRVFLVEDQERYVVDGQRSQWIRITDWCAGGEDPRDRALESVRKEIERRIKSGLR
jgi:hypothetical protein